MNDLRLAPTEDALVDVEAVRRAVGRAEQAKPEQLATALLGLGQALGIVMATMATLSARAAVLAARPVPAVEPDRLIDVREAAELLGMSVDYVREHKRELGYKKEGRLIRFSRRRLLNHVSRLS